MRDLVATQIVLNRNAFKPNTYGANKIPNFDGFEFERWEMVVSGIDMDEEPSEREAEDFTIAFTVPIATHRDPLEYLIKVLKIAHESSIELDGHFKGEYRYASDLSDVQMSNTIRFIKGVSPLRKEIKIDELDMVDSYAYAYYQTCKFILEMIDNNLEAIKFASTFDELIFLLEDLNPNA